MEIRIPKLLFLQWFKDDIINRKEKMIEKKLYTEGDEGAVLTREYEDDQVVYKLQSVESKNGTSR